ncbi:tryptase-2-like [Ruditapes philippinarum]|uniref:tryptase-2-like n=1 Tax=Ruditapes philippinarum TaxID=129788 RepID=UPI00295A9966|nr:tryptase-2-like [Ruditapes philippinarum]
MIIYHRTMFLQLIICFGFYFILPTFVTADRGGIPHWLNSGHIPPGHQHNHNSGPSSNIFNSWSGTPQIEIPKWLPHGSYPKYVAWWEEFHSNLQECGKKQTKPRNPLLRVIGGHITTIDSYPWMVSMYSDLIKQPWCGGTLISSEWVVTAAHCFRPPFNQPSTWTMHMGKNNASGFAEYIDEQVRGISELKIHTGFNFSRNDFRFDNDIALIKLDQEVIFNSHTSPLCLVKSTDRMEDLLKPETRCSITGYGISDMGNARREENALHVADVPLVDKETCLRVKDYKNQVSDNMICAGLEDGGVDTCLGDSGGPLQCQINNKWYQVGITSWGPVRCAEPRKPGVYTDISKYTEWIYREIFNDYKGNHVDNNGLIDITK